MGYKRRNILMYVTRVTSLDRYIRVDYTSYCPGNTEYDDYTYVRGELVFDDIQTNALLKSRPLNYIDFMNKFVHRGGLELARHVAHVAFMTRPSGSYMSDIRIMHTISLISNRKFQAPWINETSRWQLDILQCYIDSIPTIIEDCYNSEQLRRFASTLNDL